jgi:3-hydroxyacyl-CoA dehydrogenase
MVGMAVVGIESEQSEWLFYAPFREEKILWDIRSNEQRSSVQGLIPTLLLDIVPNKLTSAEEEAGLTLEDKEVRDRIVQKGWKAVTRSRPPAVLSQASKQFITLGNLDDDFEKLADVDWIVEVIVENLEIKQGLYKRIDSVRGEECIVSTNTSGLPVNAIAKGRSKGFQEHFLGTHFFNPP